MLVRPGLLVLAPAASAQPELVCSALVAAWFRLGARAGLRCYKWSKISFRACRVPFGDSGSGDGKKAFFSWGLVTVKRLSIALPSSPGLNSKSVLGGPGLVLRRIATVLASPGYLLLDSWPRNWIRPAGISWIWWVCGCARCGSDRVREWGAWR